MTDIPRSNIDHLGIFVPADKFESTVEWYLAALAPLKYKKIMEFPGTVGLGSQIPDFWVAIKDGPAPQNVHFAFSAPGAYPPLRL